MVPESSVLSALAVQHIQSGRNGGPLEGATSVGRFGNRGDGPYMTLWLQVQEDRITQAAYQTYGCPSAIACGSMTCEIVKGRSVEEAMRLEPEDLIVILGGLPEGKGECARMAVIALREALEIGGEN